MKFNLIVFFCLTSIISFGVYGKELGTIKNSELRHILATVEIVEDVMSPLTGGLSIRIMITNEPGECDGTAASCPKSTVYVIASEDGDYPEYLVFKFPKMYEWKYLKILSWPIGEGSKAYARVLFEAKIPTEHPKTGWWETHRYIASVNYYSGHLNIAPETKSGAQ